MKKRDFLLGLLVVIVWGANFTVIKLGLAGVPAILLVALRFTLASVPAVFFVKRPSIHWKYVVAFGATVGIGQFVCLLLSKYPTSKVAPLSLLVPITGLIVARIVLDERLSAMQWIGGAVIIAGLVIANFGMAPVKRIFQVKGK